MKKRPTPPFTTVLSEDLAHPARRPPQGRLTAFSKREEKRPTPKNTEDNEAG